MVSYDTCLNTCFRLAFRMERNAKIAKAQKEAGGASYTDLMTMAFQKSKNPLSMNLDGTISTPEKGKKANVVKEAEFGRPMTKKEKEEFLLERNRYDTWITQYLFVAKL